MKQGQKRGAGWRIAKDGQVNVQFKLNYLIEDERELLELLQYWRQRGMMKGKLKEALTYMHTLEVSGIVQGDSIVATRLETIESKVDQLLTRPVISSIPQASSGGLKPLAGNKDIPMPVIEDDDTDIVIRQDAKAAEQGSNNFMASVLGIQSVGTPH